MMKCLRSRAMFFVALLISIIASTIAPTAWAEDWNNPGEGDWFEPLNWTPNAVPTNTTDANINNGGTAVVGDGAPAVRAQNLNIGVDGGEGTLLYRTTGFLTRNLNVAQGFRLGVTENGMAPSSGVMGLNAGPGILRIRLNPANATVPFRVGYSSTDGDANGILTAMEIADLSLNDTFEAVQIGVAEGLGNATASVLVDFLSLTPNLDVQNLLEVGVSRGAGSAVARVESGVSAPGVRALAVGVAGDGGDANGWLRTGFFLGSDVPLGNAQVGVSNGAGTGNGSAVGVVDLRRGLSAPTLTFGPYVQIDIGVSNGDGDADGTVLTGTGLRAETLNLGISNGSGTATGLIRNAYGISSFNTMNLGPGATVVLNVGSNVRGSASNDLTAYGAIDVDSAVLDGTLVVNFDYIPDGPDRFELINSSQADGLIADFATVEVRNLNPGLAWTSETVLDGGVEKYVLDLTGAPLLPEWIDPGSDDWFDAGNWSTGTVPDFSQPGLIANGGEARADGATAPGPVQAFQFGIGVDGGSGALVVEGVDIETTTNLQVGVIRPGHVGGGAATGRLELADGAFRFRDDANDDAPPNVPTGRVTSIGAAYTSGSASGILSLDGADLSAIADQDVRVGWVDIEDTDSDAIASAHGELTVTGNTIWPSEADLVAARVAVDADGASGTASAVIELRDTIINDFFAIGENDTDGANSTGITSATLTVTDVTFNDGMDFAEIEIDGEGGTASSTIMATLEHVTVKGSPFDTVECDAEAPGARVLPSLVDLTVIDSVIESDIFHLSEVEADDDGRAECTSRVQMIDSDLKLGEIWVAEGEADDTATVTANTEWTVTGGSLVAEFARIGEADPADDAVAIVDGRLWLEDTTADFSEFVIVGYYDDDGAAVGNTVTARLGLTSSALDTPLLEIGVENPADHPLDAEVSLNPSYIQTDDLQLGEQSRIVLGVEGPTRATRDNLDQSGLYAAIDTGAAMLTGEVIVDIRYPAEAGDTFDVLRANPGALSGSTANFQITSALPGEAQIDIISEAGRDVLRVTITRGFAPLIVPVNHPLALIVLVLLLALAAVFFTRSRFASR